MRSDSILFDQTIPPGAQNLTIERVLPYRGRIVKMTVTNYAGQQKTLEVKPYMLKAPDIYSSLAKFAGSRKFFSGDDTTYEMAMSIQFDGQDKLCVDVTNNGLYDYDLYVLFQVEYEV